MNDASSVKALTFDLFGTVLDLGTSLEQPIASFLEDTGANVSSEQFWVDWRIRQRLEQYRDTIMMLGHSGYLATVNRSMRYVAAAHKVEANDTDFERLMSAWWQLSPFPDALPALHRLSSEYKLFILSNGDPEYLQHLANQRVNFGFDDIFSVTTVGAFKPHPAVYRRAAKQFGMEMHECLMVSSNSFDVIGARACGMRAAYVNRYGLPLEESDFAPDIETLEFGGLADTILRGDGTA